MKSRFVAVAVVTSFLGQSLPSFAETPLKKIRFLRDGAGPSHILWISGPSATLPGRDVIGIVDPLLSAVRLYTVRRSTPALALDGRLDSIGACAIPPEFRPWRILQLKNEVHVESMPQPGKNGQNAKSGDFKSDVYVIGRDIVERLTLAKLRAAGDVVDETSWEPQKSVQCGAFSGERGSVARTAPFKAERGRAQPARTIVLRNSGESLSGPGELTVRAQTGPKFQLYAVKELEPSPAGKVVQITEGVPTNDGMLRLNQRLLVFGADRARATQEINFDDTWFRSKIGQRPLMVLPTGEVLAMGRELVSDTTSNLFRIQSCGFIGAAATMTTRLCADQSQSVVAGSAPDVTSSPPPSLPLEQNVTQKPKKETANSIFARAAKLAEFSWKVDTSGLPPECRSAAGCHVPGQPAPYVPLKGIRLTRGVYSQTGYPYAQTETLRGFDNFAEAYRNGEFENALRDVKIRRGSIPGNLADHFRGDLGIDCSAMLQVAWAGRSSDPSVRLTTAVLQNGSDLSYRCPDRLPDISHIRTGDALGISVNPGADHVVLFGATLTFDGASSSWLVLESTSSCDGMCWSVYEPSFFNGWGLYRASNRQDKACPISADATSIKTAKFPSKFADWRTKVVQRTPLIKK